MKLYKEFEEALQEVADQAQERQEFGGRFIMLVRNYMDGMKDMSDMDDLIELIEPGESDED